MPTIQVSAPILLSYKGVTIFHAYRESDDNIDSPLTYHYSLSPSGELDFDVRDLPAYSAEVKLSHEFVIRAAIDSNVFAAIQGKQDVLKEVSGVAFESQDWRPFDYNAPELGLLYVRYCVPECNVDQTDGGQLVGEPTGEMRYGTALVYVEDNDGFPEFISIDRANLGEVCDTATVTHYAEAKLPKA